jgi:uncharacterized beta-barrel protein YwiB (DUF1934 family)
MNHEELHKKSLLAAQKLANNIEVIQMLLEGMYYSEDIDFDTEGNAYSRHSGVFLDEKLEWKDNE